MTERNTEAPSPEPTASGTFLAGHGRALLVRAIGGTLGLAAAVAASAWLLYAGIDPVTDAAAYPPPRNQALDAVRTWGEVAEADRTNAVIADPDLVTVDAWRILGARKTPPNVRVAELKRKPGGERRLVLARVPLARTCDSDAGWQPSWAALASAPHAVPTTAPPQGGDSPLSRLALTAKSGAPLAALAPGWRTAASGAPSWLGNEDPSRPGCWFARLDQPGWVDRIAGSPGAVIDQLISVGVDGVLLTGGDERVSGSASKPKQVMDLVARIAGRVRRAKPEFILALQDAHGLTTHRKLRRPLIRMIDAVSADGLDAVVAGSSRRTVDPRLSERLDGLRKARQDGVVVLVSGQAANALDDEKLRARLAAQGFVPHVRTERGIPGPERP